LLLMEAPFFCQVREMGSARKKTSARNHYLSRM
jgi:hypothetical protein